MPGFVCVNGKKNRRAKTTPRFYFKQDLCQGCVSCIKRCGRVDADSARAVRAIYHKIQDGITAGLVAGAINKNGSIDLYITGDLYDSRMLAHHVISKFDDATKKLLDYPDFLIGSL